MDHADGYAYEDSPAGHFTLTVFTSPAGSRHVLQVLPTRACDDKRLQSAISGHANLTKQIACKAVALAALPEMEARLRALVGHDHLSPGGYEYQFEFEDDVADARRDIVNNLADALRMNDPYRATRSFERASMATFDMDMVRAFEPLLAEAAKAIISDVHAVAAAMEMEAVATKAQLHYARAIRAWRDAPGEPAPSAAFA